MVANHILQTKSGISFIPGPRAGSYLLRHLELTNDGGEQLQHYHRRKLNLTCRQPCLVMPVPSQSTCPQIYNNPSLCPGELELSDGRALDKHKPQNNTVILLCNQHVFMCAIKKTKTMYVIVFKINFSGVPGWYSR